MSCRAGAPKSSCTLLATLATIALRLALATSASAQNETVGFFSTHVFDGGHFREDMDVPSRNLCSPIPISPSSELNRDLRWCTFRASTLLFSWS